MSDRIDYAIENGVYGRRLVLLGDWTESYRDLMQREGIAELSINYARGFSGGSVEFLRDIPFLRGLHFIAYAVKNIAAIQSLTELRSLYLASRGDQTAIDLAQLSSLEDLFIEWCPSAQSLFQLRTLKRLGILEYPKKATTDFAGLTGLKKLWISDSPVEDLSGIWRLNGLQRLEVYLLRHLSDIEGIQQLNQLERLDIGSCRGIADICPIASLHRLRWLSIGNCKQIRTISCLGGLANLKTLILNESTDVADGNLEVLRSLPSLARVAFKDRRHYSHRRSHFPEWSMPDADDRVEV